MLLTHLVVFFVLTLVLIIVGDLLDLAEVQIVGFAFLFLIGMICISNPLTYPSGEYEIMYSSFSDAECPDPDVYCCTCQLLNTTHNRTTSYSTFNEELPVVGGSLQRLIGFFLAILGLAGAVGTALSLRRFYKK